MKPQYAEYPSLRGKTVLVTGGASGIGAEIVKAFLDQGAKVGFVDIDRKASEALLAKLNGEHMFIQCDLRDINALKNAFSELAEKLGHADVLVNNAARDDRHDWRDVTAEYWDDQSRWWINHKHGIKFMVGSWWWLSGLHDSKSRSTWPYTYHGERFGRQPYPREHCRSGLDHDKAAKGALGYSRSLGKTNRPPVPT